MDLNADDKEQELQRQRDEIDRQLRKRQRASAKARKDEEDRQLIAAGSGPQKAKIQALKDATWLVAQGKKRPHSPGSDQGEAMAIDQTQNVGPKKANKVKRLKNGDLPDNEERQGGGRGEKKLGVKSLTSRNNFPASNSKTPARNTASKFKAAPPATANDSDSTCPSTPNSDNDNRSKDDNEDSSDDEEITGGDEEDLDLRGMTDHDLEKVLVNEVPRNATNLFDDDVDVETASIKSHRSYKSASSVSHPPSSESEGFLGNGDDVTGSDDDNSNESDDVPSSKRLKTRNIKALNLSSKRDQVFQAERPMSLPSRMGSSSKKTRRAATIKLESNSEDVDTKSKKKWPGVTRLNDGGLLQQNIFIRATCSDGIKIVERTLVVKDAWPELHRAAAYKREVLFEAVERLAAKDKQYRFLRERIAKDDQFVKEIGRWVIDRLSHHCGTVRGHASDRIALFQLGVNEGCAQRVKALLEHDVYVYPGEWGTDNKGNPVWVTKGSKSDVQIYLNPGLVELIKVAFFGSNTAFGYKFRELYVSNHPTDTKPELTIPLVSLSATAFFAALWEWRTGQKAKSDSKKNKNERFEGDIFKAVYQRHVNTLTELKGKINTYHRVMSMLYAKVTEENNSNGVDNTTKGNALAVLDLDDLD